MVVSGDWRQRMEWPKVLLQNEGLGLNPGFPSPVSFLKRQLCEKRLKGSCEMLLQWPSNYGWQAGPRAALSSARFLIKWRWKVRPCQVVISFRSSLISRGPSWPFKGKLPSWFTCCPVYLLAHIISSLWIYASHIENMSPKDFAIHLSVVWLHFLLNSILPQACFIPYSHSRWMTLWDAQTSSWRPQSRSHPLIPDSRPVAKSSGFQAINNSVIDRYHAIWQWHLPKK